MGEDLDQEVDLFVHVDELAQVGDVGQGDDCGATLLHLQNVREDLVDIFVVEHEENDRGLLLLIKHGQGPVTELSGGVGLGMDAGNLVELLANELGNKEAGSLGEDEDVVLALQELGNLLVLLDILWLQSVADAEAEVADVLDDLLALFLDLLLLADALDAEALLFVREPEGGQRHADHLRDEAFHVRVTVA